MEAKKNLCFKEDHKKKRILAKEFCPECKKFYCEDCLVFHQSLFSGHKTRELTNKIIFKGICNENQHSEKYEYFCKTHNKLCCSKCIIKINDNNTQGEHSKCDYCGLKEIQPKKEKEFKEKRSEIKNNLEKLEKESLENFYKYRDNKEDEKEKLKDKIVKTFQNYEKALTERKNKLLSDVEKISKSFQLEEYEKKIEILTNKIGNINELIDMSDEIKEENEITSEMEFYCKVENDLNNINVFKDEINKYPSNQKKVDFTLNLNKFKKN